MTTSAAVRVGLLGCGNVGGALVALINREADAIAARTGIKLEITRVAVRDLDKPRPVELDRNVLTTDTMALVNAEDVESSRVHAAGLVVRDCSLRVSNFRATQSLPDYLKAQGVVAIAGVDTRKLTRSLREGGAQGACILVGSDAELAVKLAQEFPGMSGQDLAKVVSIKNSEPWQEGTWQLGQGFTRPETGQYHVVAYDFGVKTNILRLMADRGCRITVVSAQMPVADVLALNPDGIFLSNGPGDPEPCDYAI